MTNKKKNAKPDWGLRLFLAVLVSFGLAFVVLNRSPRSGSQTPTSTLQNPAETVIQEKGQPPDSSAVSARTSAQPAEPPAATPFPVKEEQIALSQEELNRAAESDRITQQEANPQTPVGQNPAGVVAPEQEASDGNVIVY